MKLLENFIRFTLTKDGRSLWFVVFFNVFMISSVYLFNEIVYLRFILSIIYVLYLPGYCLIELVFTNREEMNDIERITYSFGLSIVVVILLCYMLNYSPWGITLLPLLVGLFLFTFFCSFLASIKKYQDISKRK